MFRSKLTYSNVMATVAVFAALGGTSYAAVVLTGKNIKDSSLTTKDVKNRSLLKRDFKPGQLPAGERGPQGVPGRDGVNGQNGVDGQNGAPGTAAGYIRVDHNSLTGTGSVVEGTGRTLANPPRSKGVLSVHRTADNRYCFDLSFTAEVAVGNTFINNGAFVATSVRRDTGSPPTGCPASHGDAEAIVYDQSDASQAKHADVSFSLIFEDVEGAP